MIQQRLSALLPWIVFGVVDRYGGQGATWAAVGAVIAAVTILATERDNNSGVPNILAIGAVAWFSGFALAGVFFDNPGSWLADYGRAISAFGLFAIATTSLAFIPFTEHFTRPHTRPAAWRTERFRHINVLATMMWAGIALVATGAQTIAPMIDQPSAYTVFNWVVPIALVFIGSRRADALWEKFDDQDESTIERDPLWDLTMEMNSSYADEF